MANILLRAKDILLDSVKSMIGAVEYAGVFPPGGIYSGPNISSGQYRGGGDGGMWLFGNDGFNYKFSYKTNADAGGAYATCAPLAAIINKKAKSYINGVTEIVNSQGKPATSSDAKRLRKLLKRPNPLQSWKQFEAQQQIYIGIYGYVICLPIIPAGFEKYGPIEAQTIWNIPPFMVDVKESNRLFYESNLSDIIVSVVLKYKDIKTVLDVSNLYIFRDFTPSFGSVIFPESRVGPLQTQISNILGAYESRSILINRRGAMGILSSGVKDTLGPIAIDDDEKKQLQQGFSSYGLRNEQWQVIVTNAQLQWQQMGYPTKDLMLFEEIEEDIMRICDSYDFPYRLLSSTRNNSLGGSDADIFLKNLYQDAIIPEADSTYEQWNLFFKTDDLNVTLTKNYSHIPSLQEDKVRMGLARFNMNRALQIEFENNLIRVNQWLEENGMEPRQGPEGDMYYSDMVEAGIAIGSGVGRQEQPAPEAGATQPATTAPSSQPSNSNP